MAFPMSSGESSWTKWTPLTVTSVCARKLRARSSTLPPARIPPGSAFRNSLGTLLVFSRVGVHDRSHVSGVALDGDLSGPRQRRPSALAGLGERPTVFRHLLFGELPQYGAG